MRIMFKTFYPDEYVASTYVLDFEKMYREGCRGLVFDIDNTLVPHGAPADERAICLFDRLRSIGFDTCLISNNQEPRVKPFAEKVQSKYVFHEELYKSHGADANGQRKHCIYRRSAFYGCVGSEAYRDEEYSGEADQSKRRDPDCAEKISGEDCITFL